MDFLLCICAVGNITMVLHFCPFGKWTFNLRNMDAFQVKANSVHSPNPKYTFKSWFNVSF